MEKEKSVFVCGCAKRDIQREASTTKKNKNLNRSTSSFPLSHKREVCEQHKEQKVGSPPCKRESGKRVFVNKAEKQEERLWREKPGGRSHANLTKMKIQAHTEKLVCGRVVIAARTVRCFLGAFVVSHFFLIVHNCYPGNWFLMNGLMFVFFLSACVCLVLNPFLLVSQM